MKATKKLKGRGDSRCEKAKISTTNEEIVEWEFQPTWGVQSKKHFLFLFILRITVLSCRKRVQPSARHPPYKLDCRRIGKSSRFDLRNGP